MLEIAFPKYINYLNKLDINSPLNRAIFIYIIRLFNRKMV